MDSTAEAVKPRTVADLTPQDLFVSTRHALDPYSKMYEGKLLQILATPAVVPARLVDAATVAADRAKLAQSLKENGVAREEAQQALDNASAVLLRMVAPEGRMSKVKEMLKPDSLSMFNLIDRLTLLTKDTSYDEFDFDAETRDRELADVLLSALGDTITNAKSGKIDDSFTHLPRPVQEALVKIFTHSEITTQAFLEALLPKKTNGNGVK